MAYRRHGRCLAGIKTPHRTPPPPNPGRWRCTHTCAMTAACAWRCARTSLRSGVTPSVPAPTGRKTKSPQPSRVGGGESRGERGWRLLGARGGPPLTPPEEAPIVCAVISSVVLLALCWPGHGPFFLLPTRALRFKLQPTRWRLSAGLRPRRQAACGRAR